MAKPKRDRRAEHRAAEAAYDATRERDESVSAGLMNGDGEVVHLPILDDEVLTTSMKLRAAEPQQVTVLKACNFCQGNGIVQGDGPCPRCDGYGRYSITREMTKQERSLLKAVTG